jgi:hypothetical protein
VGPALAEACSRAGSKEVLAPLPTAETAPPPIELRVHLLLALLLLRRLLLLLVAVPLRLLMLIEAVERVRRLPSWLIRLVPSTAAVAVLVVPVGGVLPLRCEGKARDERVTVDSQVPTEATAVKPSEAAAIAAVAEAATSGPSRRRPLKVGQPCRGRRALSRTTKPRHWRRNTRCTS